MALRQVDGSETGWHRVMTWSTVYTCGRLPQASHPHWQAFQNVYGFGITSEHLLLLYNTFSWNCLKASAFTFSMTSWILSVVALGMSFRRHNATILYSSQTGVRNIVRWTGDHVTMCVGYVWLRTGHLPPCKRPTCCRGRCVLCVGLIHSCHNPKHFIINTVHCV